MKHFVDVLVGRKTERRWSAIRLFHRRSAPMVSDSFVPSSTRCSAPMVIVVRQTGFDDSVDFERHHTFDRAIPSSRRFASLGELNAKF
jgi:hypothetical protein